MINYITGNILESDSQALVNTVNTFGVMGKGIALQFKNQFPFNTKEYIKACKIGSLKIGNLLVVEDSSLLHGEKIIINFPTKTDWRKPSEYQYIELGLTELVKVIEQREIKSISIPPLGAGNGGLDWYKVKTMMEKYLSNVNCDIYIYEPNSAVKEILKKERVPLTPARAMLLFVLYDLVKEGEFVSEFACEKVCYFLQKFGASQIFKLDFKPNFYGPYSGKVKHVLYYLNGSYLTGYSGKDTKPFEEINLFMDAEIQVNEYLGKYPDYNDMAQKTKEFLRGFYSNFGLELLSTLDFIIDQTKSTDLVLIKDKLNSWSRRKSNMFSNESFLIKGINKLKLGILDH